METSIYITADGSHTLYVPEIDESYHSNHGAIQESKHIFIDTGLSECSKQFINVLEVGFGTGLNAFMAIAATQCTNQFINYTAFEKYPLPTSKALQLNYSEILNHNAAYVAIHECEWENEIAINPNFILKKLECDFTKIKLEKQFDIVFFDAFSPDKQPEMWTESQFEKIYAACNDGAILTTYCAKGIVRRALQAAGFKVERLPGPPGKREILRARKVIS